MKTATYFALALFIAALYHVQAFVSPMGRSSSRTTGYAAAPLQMTILTYGNKKKNFKPGTPLKNAVAQLGIKPNYSCNKGDCATCQILLAGQFTKPCVAKVPAEPKQKSLQENGLPISL